MKTKTRGQSYAKYKSSVLPVSDNLNQMYSISLKWKWTVLMYSDKWHALGSVQSFQALPHSLTCDRINISCGPWSSQFHIGGFM